MTNTKNDAGCLEVGARYLTELLASAPLYERTEIQIHFVCLLTMEERIRGKIDGFCLPNGAAAS